MTTIPVRKKTNYAGTAPERKKTNCDGYALVRKKTDYAGTGMKGIYQTGTGDNSIAYFIL